MAESKKSVLSNMTELEDVIAASIQGVRDGLVKERKELFQALDAQSKETAKVGPSLFSCQKDGQT
jgi:hypothetical protein